MTDSKTGKYDLGVHVRLRGRKGSKDSVSIILQYLKEDFPFDFDTVGDTRELFIHRHLCFALSQRGDSEEIIQRMAHEAVGYFEGIISAIKEEANIKEPSLPDNSSFASSDKVAVLKSAYSNQSGKGLAEKKNDNSVQEDEEIDQNFGRMREMFSVN